MTDLGEHCSRRTARTVKPGYHVHTGGAWVLVDAVEKRVGAVLLMAGEVTLTLPEDCAVWSRSPAQQVYAVSAALPMRGRIGTPKRPLGNPFGGSAPTPIWELAGKRGRG